MLDQYDKLRKRNAFLAQYKKIENITEAFDNARLVELITWGATLTVCTTCEELRTEYKACESPDYVSFGSSPELAHVA